VFPWHSQKQVASKLWRSTFPCPTVNQLLSVDMCISGVDKCSVRCLQDKPRKLRGEEWREEGSPDSVGYELKGRAS